VFRKNKSFLFKIWANITINLQVLAKIFFFLGSNFII